MIRDAVPSTDAAACAAIYAPYVIDTEITFETEAPDAAEFQQRIERAQDQHVWLIAENDGDTVGYAYAVPFKARAAYRFSCEVSVYLAPSAHGQGIGGELYVELLDRLAKRGMRMACAGITLPNDASLALHRSLGFTESGIYRRIGWKHGRWRDVAWFQKGLGDDPDAPPAGA
nr:N-acetyltransferase family protein [Flexivirga meconopsidis]